MITLTVIVCTHNPRRDYFLRMMESLRKQSLPSAHWELLIVDNASQIRLADVWDLSWHPNESMFKNQNLASQMPESEA